MSDQKNTMRLSIFAYHVSSIMTLEGEFELHPCNGVAVKVKIERALNAEFPGTWDTVYINGKSAGNRHGGVQAFTELVNAAKPVIEYT